MGANCYLCERRFRTIPGQSSGDAVGACKLCGVLACQAHGVRNASRPAYLCGCCVPSLLAAAAVAHLGTGIVPPKPPPGDQRSSPDQASGFETWAGDVNEVGDVIGDLVDDRWAWLQRDMESLSVLFSATQVPAELSAFARQDAGRSRSLIAAAAAMAMALHLPPQEMIPVLQQVVQAVGIHV